jgi:hypothetical protein
VLAFHDDDDHVPGGVVEHDRVGVHVGRTIPAVPQGVTREDGEMAERGTGTRWPIG